MNRLLTRRVSPERTFESLYRRHVTEVYRYALAMLDRQADAEDATQTTFINAYKALQGGERPRNARKWLRAITRNVCREHHRRAGRRPSEVSLDEDCGALVLEPATSELADVLRGLSVLPFNQRSALVMREFEGRSLREIAGELELSLAAVETLLFRARRTLREQLQGTLTCSDAERAISRQLDGALTGSERGPLRAHLRECSECAALARRVRAQRGAMRSLAIALPLPPSLQMPKLLGGGPASSGAVSYSSGAGFALGGKLVALTLAGVGVAGAGYVSLLAHHDHRPPNAPPSAMRLAAVPTPMRLATLPTAERDPAGARRTRRTRARSIRATRASATAAHRSVRRAAAAAAAERISMTHVPARYSHTAHGHSATAPRRGQAHPVASLAREHAYGLSKPKHGYAYGTGRSRGSGHRPGTRP